MRWFQAGSWLRTASRASRGSRGLGSPAPGLSCLKAEGFLCLARRRPRSQNSKASWRAKGASPIKGAMDDGIQRSRRCLVRLTERAGRNLDHPSLSGVRQDIGRGTRLEDAARMMRVPGRVYHACDGVLVLPPCTSGAPLAHMLRGMVAGQPPASATASRLLSRLRIDIFCPGRPGTVDTGIVLHTR